MRCSIAWSMPSARPRRPPSRRVRGKNPNGRRSDHAEPLTMLATRFAPANCARLVVKIGSALLVDPAGHVRRDWLAGVVADIADRVAAGQRVAVVSSGAIALGARRLGLPKGGRASLED